MGISTNLPDPSRKSSHWNDTQTLATSVYIDFLLPSAVVKSTRNWNKKLLETEVFEGIMLCRID